MRTRRLALPLALFIPFIASGQAPARPDTVRGHSGLAGYVRDTLRRPLAAAGIIMEGENVTAVTDDSGHFHLGGLPGGVHTVTVKRVGYQAISFEATLPTDSTLLIDVHLRNVQNLEPVVVTGSKSVRLAQTGFLERQRIGAGTFLSPEHIDSMSFLDRPSSLLRNVRGVDIRCVGALCSVRPHLASCLWLYVDGVQQQNIQLDELLTTGAIYAIEVYDHPSTVPPEFQGRLPVKAKGINATPIAGCEALVVWTRTKAAP
jgi:hypothetical protein